MSYHHPTDNEIRTRILSNINKTSYCWWWTGMLDLHLYGRIKIRGKTTIAHRAVLTFICKINIPPNKDVMHICDNPQCVNPEHLKIVDTQENMIDASRKQRLAIKLTSTEVASIRQLYKNGGRTMREIAKMFGVNPSQISRIINNLRRAHEPTI